MALLSDISNPWKGLSSYTEGEILYGRDKDIESLFTLITTNQEITILYGQSGIGKTSLLRAGLFPWLRSSHIFPVYVRLGHDETDKSYVAQVIETVENEAQKYNIKQTDLAPNTEAPKSLWEFLHRYDFHTESGEKCVPMIFFDQFEELFTISANRSKYVEEFIKDLGNVLNETTPDYLLEDPSAKPEVSESKKENVSDNESELNLDLEIDIDEQDTSSLKTKRDFLLAISIREDYIYHLDRISAAIPALKRNRYFLHGLDETGAREVIKCPVKNLVDNTVTNEIIGVCHNAGEKYISPAFISLLMYNLFERMQQKGQSTITSSLVSGSIGDIFYNYYVNSIKRLSENSIDFLEDRLISKGGFRLTVPVSDALAAGVTEGEIKQLEDKRLIVRSKRGNNDFIELTHDLLCKEITKDKEERDKIKKARQNKKRTILLSSVIAIVLVIAGVFIWQYFEINKRENALLISQSRAVAGIADQLVDQGDSYLARLLTLEVLPLDLNNPNRPYTEEAEGAFRKSLLYNNAIIRTEANRIAVNPNGKTFVSGNQEGDIYLWKIADGKQLWKIDQAHKWRINTLAFSPDGKKIASGSEDRTIKIWDAQTGEQIGQTLEGQRAGIKDIDFSPDGDKIVSCGNHKDSNIFIWDVEKTEQIGSPLEGHTSFVNSVAFSPDGSKIVSGSYDQTIRIWNAETGKQIGEPISGINNEIDHVVFSPDGRKITAVIHDNTIRIWDAQTREPLGKPFEGHTSFINSIAFSPDGKKIVSDGNDLAIRIWDVETGEEIEKHTYYNGSSWGTGLGFDSNFEKFVFISEYDQISLLDKAPNMLSKAQIKENDNFNRRFNRPIHIVNPQGNILAFLDKNIIHLFDTQTGERICPSLEGNSSMIISVAFSPDGKKLLSRSKDKTLRLWDAYTGKQIGKPLNLDLKDSIMVFFEGMAFSPKGEKIAFDQEGTIRIWDSDLREEISNMSDSLSNGIANINLAFSNDGTKIAAYSKIDSLYIWDIESQTKRLIPIKQSLNGYIGLPIFFSPDDKRILCSQINNLIWCFDIETGENIWTRTKSEFLSNNIFSPDGRFCLAFTHDINYRAILLINIETGKTFLEIPIKEESSYPVNCTFSSDGTKIVVVCDTGNIYTYEWKPLQELMDEQRERFKDRKLTPEERQKYYLE